MAKRHERSAAQLRRRGPQREPYLTVLIVCEGERTEVEYLKGLCRAHRLSSANITVVGRGTDPVSVVRFAIEKAQREGGWDRVYCVFDRDRHANYARAIENLNRADLGGTQFQGGITNPCFEFWILLHFEYTARPYRGAGRRSPCDIVIADLKRHLPNYEKNDEGLFTRLEPRVQDAIRHAERLVEHNRQTGSDNPATSVHGLVRLLIDLKPS